MGALTSTKLNITTRIMKFPTTKSVEVRHPQPQMTPGNEDSEEQNWVIIFEEHVGTDSASLNICLDYKITQANVGLDVFWWKWS